MLHFNIVQFSRYISLKFADKQLLFISVKKFLVGSSGLEPPTSRLSGVRSNHLSYEPLLGIFAYAYGGDERDRTDDPLLAKQVLSQLSYTPINGSKLCGVHSSRLLANLKN